MPSTFAPTDSLQGRIAVITGGTGAIGLATAKRLASLGARCVLLYNSESAESAAAKAAALPGSGHLCFKAPITDSQALKSVAAEIEKQCSVVHILVNSAGYTKAVPAADLEALTDDLIDDILKVNFRGVMSTIRAFMPMLKKSEDGLIVNISSIAGFTGTGSNLAYVAAKASIDVVGDALAKAFAPHVRVISVSPGVVDSTFVPGRGADFNGKVASTIPLKRIGTVDDVASVVQACATTMRYVTGTRIVVDGGRHL
jgi:NAD(P)-dependent dehydrogenase (short-subunit alcohol dehydrogenase family)